MAIDVFQNNVFHDLDLLSFLFLGLRIWFHSRMKIGSLQWTQYPGTGINTCSIGGLAFCRLT